MYDNVIWCMEQTRKKRIEAHTRMLVDIRRYALQALLQALAARPEARRYQMSLCDIALLPEFRAVALGPRLVDDGDVAPLHAEFSHAVERWRLRAYAGLRELVAADTGGCAGPGPGVDPLELATTKFRCECYRHKNEALFFPAILSHRCPPTPTSDGYEEAIRGVLTDPFARMLGLEEGVWRHDIFSVDETSELSRRLVELCGMDPGRATAKDMDDAGVWFVLDDESVMSWRAAVRRTSSFGRDDALVTETHRYSTRTEAGSSVTGVWRPRMRCKQLRSASGRCVTRRRSGDVEHAHSSRNARYPMSCCTYRVCKCIQ